MDEDAGTTAPGPLETLAREPEDAFDSIVRIAALVCATPMAGISVVDDDNQWFKATTGFEADVVRRADAFCGRTVEHGDLLEIEDAAADARWEATAYVVGPPHVRFYAGTPLVATDGQAIGTLCVLDTRPRRLDDRQRAALRALAAQAMAQVELRHQVGEVEAARAELRASERRHRALIERSADLILLANPGTGERYVSPAAVDILGLAPEDVRDVDLRSLVDDPDSQEDAVRRLTAATGDWSEPVELRMRHRDGSLRWVEVRAANRLGDPDLDAWVFTVHDATRRHRAEEALRDILDTANDAYVQTDLGGTITGWNREAERTFGWSRDEALGADVEELLVPARLRHDDAFGALRALVTANPAGRIVERIDAVVLHRDGGELPVELTVWATRGADGGTRLNAFLRDMTERNRFEDQLVRQALHDELTGLPNRSLLLDRLESALARCRRNGTLVGVLFCDLDHFKVVNDSHGHSTGDTVLRVVAERLVQSIRAGDTVARFGGDEFVIVADCVDDQLEASRLGGRVLRALEAPITLPTGELRTSASIGIATSDGRASAEELLRDADTAMYRAKDRGRSRIEVFDAELRAKVQARLEDEQALRRALAEHELRLLFQPVVSLRRGTVVGAEALVRWQRPGRGLLTPDRFVPLAEETGLVGTLGRWVLDTACEQLRAWADELGGRRLTMAVNVSAHQLRADLAGEVEAALTATRTRPSDLALELTESSLVEDPDVATAALRELRRRGTRIAVDDFGTGYSSLAYLKALPIDTLKIDRCFVTNLAVDRYDTAIVGAITTIAGALGLRVVAEGVETAEQLAEVRAHGCTLAQGFHFAEPLEPAAFVEFVRERPGW